MNLDFFLIKQKHRMWCLKMKAYLLDIQEFDEERVISHSACDLGKWLSEVALPNYGNLPEIVELDTIHKIFHDTVKQIVMLKKQGFIHEAYIEFTNLKNTSESIIKWLDTIEEKVNQ